MRNAVVPQIPELIGHAILNSRLTGFRRDGVSSQPDAGGYLSGIIPSLELPGSKGSGPFPSEFPCAVGGLSPA
jgi:hypothetical protein